MRPTATLPTVSPGGGRVSAPLRTDGTVKYFTYLTKYEKGYEGGCSLHLGRFTHLQHLPDPRGRQAFDL